jgi:KaiC/GvpD/RAD55 family RecA-like ATPase
MNFDINQNGERPMRKIKSGVVGLDSLLDGGLNENSATVVIGTSGAGKTTFAAQFLRRGLERGNDALFVSLDENQDQIIKEAVEMGWSDIHDYLEDGSLVFIDASGKKFSKFFRHELPTFVEEWKGSESRIVVDPLTPVIWSTEGRYEQRELLMVLLKETKKIGTVVCTLEEHGARGDLSGNEIVIPMYLADSVIHLKYSRTDGATSRLLEIIKCRNSRHSAVSHPYTIVRGFGLLVQGKAPRKSKTTKSTEDLKRQLRKYEKTFSKRVWSNIISSLDNLNDEDFADVDLNQLVDDLVTTYSEEKDVNAKKNG